MSLLVPHPEPKWTLPRLELGEWTLMHVVSKKAQILENLHNATAYTWNPSYMESLIHGIPHTWNPSYMESLIHGTPHTWNPSYMEPLIHGTPHTWNPSFEEHSSALPLISPASNQSWQWIQLSFIRCSQLQNHQNYHMHALWTVLAS